MGEHTEVYLCATDSGYVHCAFDTLFAATKWCEEHSEYHVIIRTVYFYASEVK